MTDWDCIARPTDSAPGKAAFNREYVMKPGDAYLYDVGVLHSPERKGDTRLLRIEGMNMAKVKRFPYEAVDAQPGRGIIAAKAGSDPPSARFRNDLPFLDDVGLDLADEQCAVVGQGLHFGGGAGTLQSLQIIIPKFGDAIDVDIGFRDVRAGPRTGDM